VRSRPIALEIVGELSALLNQDIVVITAEHNTILVDLPKLRTGLVVWRTVGKRAQQGITMQRVVATLEFTDLTVHFRLAGRTVARLGAEAHPGLAVLVAGCATAGDKAVRRGGPGQGVVAPPVLMRTEADRRASRLACPCIALGAERVDVQEHALKVRVRPRASRASSPRAGGASSCASHALPPPRRPQADRNA
jgi:hypothetical protein